MKKRPGGALGAVGLDQKIGAQLLLTLASWA